MSVELDHAIVSVPDKQASAGLLAELLDVPWDKSGGGHFTAVYIDDGLTLDFDESDDAVPMQHFCFRVSEDAFDQILARIRAKGIAYRSTPQGAVDMQINTRNGGRNIYWDAPEGVVWEILTVSYARQS